jgi:2-polyprenyl-3-methyl-5-hydroxy-6-metoxy-1,4-benzoquinol methylase
MSMMHIPDGSAQERAKYAEIWAFPEYQAAHSPGLENVDRFIEVMKPKPFSTIADIGCGSGKAGLAFQRQANMQAHWVDLTAAGLDPEVDRSRFTETPLWNWRKTRALAYDYGFCCDVLEHIPTEYTMLCIARILENCRTAWLQISLQPDNFGPKLLGEPLHLTVRPYDWWLIRIATLGEVVDARDLCGVGLYVVERK